MTKELSPILKHYIPIADLLVQTFGEDCEVVLHDLSTPQQSVVYVANNHVTGRKVGDSFHHLVSQAILAEKTDNGVIANYYFQHKNKLIRSSSLLIRDLDGRLVGALCINLDTTKLTEHLQWLGKMLPDLKQAPTSLNKIPFATESIDPQTINRSVMDIVNNVIDSVINEVPQPHTREQRLEMIRFMETRGVFLVKGAIDRVSEKLGISKVTVYSYLDEIRS
jgi:predicted transcriptional regulator YheO